MVDTPTQLPTRPETGSLDDLTSRIKTAHTAVLEAARNVVVKAIAAGQLLKEAKAKVPGLRAATVQRASTPRRRRY
jgi:hypothetical protein